MSNQTQQQKYFNLHISGIGYVNDIREVTPKKGKAFLACRIAALVGEANEPDYRFFDMNVIAEDAKALIKRCIPAVEAKKKVLVSFVMSDLWCDTFTYAKDNDFHKKGDVGVSMKGRLIRIGMIKVDGELKYKAPANTDVENAESDESQSA